MARGDGSAAGSDGTAKPTRWQNKPKTTEKGAVGVKTNNALNWLAQGRGQEGRTLGKSSRGGALAERGFMTASKLNSAGANQPGLKSPSHQNKAATYEQPVNNGPWPTQAFKPDPGLTGRVPGPGEARGHRLFGFLVQCERRLWPHRSAGARPAGSCADTHRIPAEHVLQVCARAAHRREGRQAAGINPSALPPIMDLLHGERQAGKEGARQRLPSLGFAGTEPGLAGMEGSKVQESSRKLLSKRAF